MQAQLTGAGTCGVVSVPVSETRVEGDTLTCFRAQGWAQEEQRSRDRGLLGWGQGGGVGSPGVPRTTPADIGFQGPGARAQAPPLPSIVSSALLGPGKTSERMLQDCPDWALKCGGVHPCYFGSSLQNGLLLCENTPVAQGYVIHVGKLRTH